MADEAVKRKYKLADTLLKQKADALKDTVQRDIADFQDRGVSDTSVLESHITAFDDVASDQYYRGLVGIANQDLDTKEDALGKSLRTLRTMAVNKWKNRHDARYVIYDFDRLDEEDGHELVGLAKNILKVATDQLADLGSEGLTQVKLDAIEAERVAMDEAIDEVRQRERERNLARQDRINKGNALYGEIVRLTNIGKDLYAQSNEAKYNDYIIYNTVGGQEPAPPPPPPAPAKAALGGDITDDSNNEPVDNATIKLMQNGVVKYTFTTNALGRYDGLELDPGQYQMSVEASGMVTFSGLVVNLTAGQSEEIDIAMMPEVEPPS